MKKTTANTKRSWLSAATFEYKRRDESEVIRIVQKVQSGFIGIRAASIKYGLCRRTLRLWITRLSIRNFPDDLSTHLLSSMTDMLNSIATERKVKELSKALKLV